MLFALPALSAHVSWRTRSHRVKGTSEGAYRSLVQMTPYASCPLVWRKDFDMSMACVCALASAYEKVGRLLELGNHKGPTSARGVYTMTTHGKWQWHGPCRKITGISNAGLEWQANTPGCHPSLIIGSLSENAIS